MKQCTKIRGQNLEVNNQRTKIEANIEQTFVLSKIFQTHDDDIV